MDWMRKLAWVAAVAMMWLAGAQAQNGLQVKRLRCEYKADPIGIDVAQPRLSWILESGEKNVLQTSYEVHVAGSAAELAKNKLIWTSGKVQSDISVGVEYAGPTLETGRIYYWRVRVGDNHGHLSEWSDTAAWEMGLLQAADWKAKWITPGWSEDVTKPQPSPLLRREFAVKKKVQRARLYATALGLYEMATSGCCKSSIRA